MSSVATGTLDRPLSIAPMMDWTDRHDRYFLRLVTRRALLYTEMITTAATASACWVTTRRNTPWHCSWAGRCRATWRPVPGSPKTPASMR
jgi:hypothetical protein